eukprot:TRINITY_DN9107_c0_g1_i1.p1 TRINITY_DN9107_c0_g1~~TRINITY_DN9107_c0_g1_i1.p1  ORF type:complete len:199 (+),score=41.17 TRINITY_DN9107_c0_g1_i1:689-1285(+)
MFGDTYNTNTPLQEAPEHAAADLNELNRKLLHAFQLLVMQLTTAPEQGLQRAREVEEVLKTIHEAINARRAEQAKEGLLSMLEQQANSKKALASEIRSTVATVRASLKDMSSTLRGSIGSSPFDMWPEGLTPGLGAGFTPGTFTDLDTVMGNTGSNDGATARDDDTGGSKNITMERDTANLMSALSSLPPASDAPQAP